MFLRVARLGASGLAMDTETGNAGNSNQAYKVLARKYRPTRFEDLIGQEALVQTLSNAINMNRIAHAFLLTGIRGIGKTTTARIIARALNCVGPDGKGGPTINPCGECEQCLAIAADRHVDVLEMDAASRTGVGDIREIIENVHYRPVSGRYKIYIIDEVHMLSNSAFNALLKTLEEPPPHAKFIFATTELRKIPVTVLSRCQRFDLRRVDAAAMQAHLTHICEKEAIQATPAALAMIARASEGSVRDALSLLDQAIAHAMGQVEEHHIQAMIGTADRGRIFDLLEHVSSGRASEAVQLAQSLYYEGMDPSLLLTDSLDVLHVITQIQLMPDMAADLSLPADVRQRASEMAQKLSMPALVRAWQTLFKGLQEVKQAPSPLQALTMVLVRLAYMSELPPPNDLWKLVKPGSGSSAQAAPVQFAPKRQEPLPVMAQAPVLQIVPQPPAVHVMPPLANDREANNVATTVASPEDFHALVALFSERREMVLHQLLRSQVVPVECGDGRLVLKPVGSALTPDFAGRISHCLRVWTGAPWMVVLDETAEAKTESIAAKEASHAKHVREALLARPDVKEWLEAFPGAEVEDVKPPEVSHSAEDELLARSA
ncbi:DNA polymerase III subunit gamma/tau [bacterium]|nr:DNA polymerase III subunit gamma/tau [bacterium]